MRPKADPDLTECLRLQGYPDDYLDELRLSDSAKYRMIGNSICVPVVTWLAKRLAMVLKQGRGQTAADQRAGH